MNESTLRLTAFRPIEADESYVCRIQWSDGTTEVSEPKDRLGAARWTTSQIEEGRARGLQMMRAWAEPTPQPRLFA